MILRAKTIVFTEKTFKNIVELDFQGTVLFGVHIFALGEDSLLDVCDIQPYAIVKVGG